MGPLSRSSILVCVAAVVMSGCGERAADAGETSLDPDGPGAETSAPLVPSTGAVTSTSSPVAAATTTDAGSTTTTATTTPPTTIAAATTTSTTSTTSTTTSTTTTTTLPVVQTSCRQVVHIGDSTGVYLWEPEHVGGDSANTMASRYRAVGVETVYPDNSGGRSIIERIAPWQTNALEVADAVRANGYRGCWVLMIGTNDAANVGTGATVGLDERIGRLLDVIDGDPVLWIDTVTLLPDGEGYSDANMRAFNAALERAAALRPNVGVFRWSEFARPEWFQDDGIHYRADGRINRAAIVALMLTEFFPA